MSSEQTIAPIHKWDKFRFFEQSIVSDKPPGETTSEKPNSFLFELNIVGIAAGKHYLFVAEQERRAETDVAGNIWVITQEYKPKKVTCFTKSIKKIQFVNDYIIAVGDDQEKGKIYKGMVKVYSPRNDSLELETDLELFDVSLAENVDYSIPFIEASDDQQCYAIAIDSTERDLCGKIVIFRGDICTSSFWKKETRFNQAITGGTIVNIDGNNYAIFVSTTANIFKLTSTSSGVQQTEWTSFGCEPKCLASLGNRLIVATSDGLHQYNVTNKTPERIYPIPDKKLFLKNVLENYLFIIRQDSELKRCFVDILDLKSKFIIYEMVESFEPKIVDVCYEWNSIFIWTRHLSRNKLIRLTMKDTQQQLDILLQKHKFDQALPLAKSMKPTNNSLVLEIRKRYGDYLFNKREWDLAIKQYIKTIGYLEPSYVIRKFLNSQTSEKLDKYLEVLHKLRKHNDNHTELLLKCYTKISDREKVIERLKEFIQQHSELHYNPETAIKTLREAGYPEQAIELAKNFREHFWYVKIHMEDLPTKDAIKNSASVISYIETLDFEDAEKIMKAYGKQLLSVLPQATTNLLIRLCVKYIRFDEEDRTTDRTITTNCTFNFNKKRKKQTHVKQSSGGYSSFLSFGSNQVTEMEPEEDLDFAKRANAEDFICLFGATAEERFWLMVFLENVIERLKSTAHPQVNPDPNRPLKPEIYATLIEMYLRFKNSSEDERPSFDNDKYIYEYRSNQETLEEEKLYFIEAPNRETFRMTFEEKALYILETQENEEPKSQLKKKNNTSRLLQVLIIAQSQQFVDGVLLLYEKLGLYYDILHYYMEKQDKTKEEKKKTHEKLIDAVVRLSIMDSGEYDTHMWSFVLNYFASLATEENTYESEISTVLSHIEENNILTPIEVINILSKNRFTQLKLLKNYLIERLEVEQNQKRNLMKIIRDRQAETAQLENDIERLRTQAVVFQSRICNICQEELDLPTIHFMDGRSCHQRCYNDYPIPDDTNTFTLDENAFFSLLSKEKDKAFENTVKNFGRSMFKDVFNDDAVDFFEDELKEYDEEDYYDEDLQDYY